MRRQVAPLPSMLARCAAAYANGNAPLGDTMLPAALNEAAPAITATIKRHPGVIFDERDDIRQEANIRIMRQLKRGIQPTIATVTYHTIVDTHRKQNTASRNATNQYEQLAEPDDSFCADRIISTIDGDAILSELGRMNPHWALVAQYRIDGLTERQLATHLNTSRGEIRKALAAIREHLEQRA